MGGIVVGYVAGTLVGEPNFRPDGAAAFSGVGGPAMAAAAEPLFRERFLIGQTAETIRRMAHTFKGVSA